MLEDPNEIKYYGPKMFYIYCPTAHLIKFCNEWKKYASEEGITSHKIIHNQSSNLTEAESESVNWMNCVLVEMSKK